MQRWIVAAAAALMAVACRAPGAADPALEEAVTRASDTGSIPPPLDIGVDPSEPRAVARIGDRVVAHVVAQTGEGVVERYITLELVGALGDVEASTIDVQQTTGVRSSKGFALTNRSWSMSGSADAWIYVVKLSCVVDVEVFDRGGALLATRRIGTTLITALATNAATEAMVYSAGAGSLFSTILAVPALDDLLMDVAKAPPLWTLFNGIKLTLEWPHEGLLLLDGDLFELPSRIDADGHVALTGRVVQGPKASPYLLCAGLRRIEAHHPNRADRRASITIVGARRGAGAPLVDERLGAFSAPDKNGLVTFDESVIEAMAGPGPYLSGGVAR